jgi:hypothetical protein
MRLKPACWFAALWVTTGVSYGDAADDFIRAEMKRQNIPGLSLAVIKDGQVINAAELYLPDR